MEQTEREKYVKEANEMPLYDLCLKVLHFSYIPGIHDDILLSRLKELNTTLKGLEKATQTLREANEILARVNNYLENNTAAFPKEKNV